jgi:hypothetical protein
LAGGAGGSVANYQNDVTAGTATGGGAPGTKITGSGVAHGIGGTANTGGGGSGGGTIASNRANASTGGSGIIFLRVPDTITATFSAGVTYTTHTPTGYNVYEVTAAGASDTVTFS